MQDIVTIGSSLIDIFIKSAHFEVQKDSTGAKLCQLYGEKLEVDSFEVRTGGGGSNTGVGFARAGFTVATISETGKDTFAGVIVDELHAEFVSTAYLIQEKKEQTGGSVILVGNDGGRTVMVHRGASSLLDPQDIPAQVLDTAEWVHLSSISGRLETLRKIGSSMQKNKGKLSWNPGRGELELLRTGQLQLSELSFQILLLNDSEWQSIAELHSALKAQVAEIIITNGSAPGRIYLSGENAQEINFTPPQSQVVDETGAGDAFAVGYVSSRLHGLQPQQALAAGLKNAQSVIKYFGAKQGLLKQAELVEVT